MNITFIGIGDMGSQMVPHLLNGNNKVTIWDRDESKMRQEKKNYPDVLVATSLKEAVRASELIITSVMFEDVLDLHIGTDKNPGIVDYLKEGSYLVVTSTLDPDKITQIKEKMPERTHIFDAPMIGGVEFAKNGNVVFIVGGNRESFNHIEATLSLMGKVEYAGKLNNGAKLKLVTNDVIMAAEAGIRETLDLADAYDVSYDMTLKLLQMGPLKAVVDRALDQNDPRPLSASLADVNELISATDKIIDLPIVKSSRDRLTEAVDATDGKAKFIDITDKKTALPQYRHLDNK